MERIDGDQLVPGKLAYTIAEFVKAARISRSAVYAALASGQLEARKLGTRTLILTDAANAFLNALPVMRATARVTIDQPCSPDSEAQKKNVAGCEPQHGVPRALPRNRLRSREAGSRSDR